MKNSVWISVSLFAAFGLASCTGHDPSTVAAASTAPLKVSATGAVTSVTDIPVGPIPGPAVESQLPMNPFGEDMVARTEGRQLFVHYNCYGCHGGHAGGGMGPSLRNGVFEFGGDPAHVFASIAQGRGKGMPAWGVMIPEDQIWKLVSYIKSLGTPLEPDKPTPVEELYTKK